MIQRKSDKLVGFQNVQNIKQRLFCNFSKHINKLKQRTDAVHRKMNI